MEILAVDGHVYTQLHITDYEIGLEVLDSEATGRTKGYGWVMIRDPQGVLCNLYIEVAQTQSKNPDFIHLWRTVKRMGKEDFVKIKFRDPVGDLIEQQMYLVIGRIKCKRFEQDGTIYTDVIKVSFIAQRGF